MIDKEDLFVYYRPQLSEYIENDHVINELFLHDQRWYEKHRVTLKLGYEVESIDTLGNQVVLNNGEKVPYDKLILGCGSSCFVPAIENVNIDGVFTLRSLADANRIKALTKNSHKAIIIGGGLLGLEIANAFNQLSIDSTVVEIADRVLPRQADERASEYIEAAIINKGITLLKSSSVKAIVGENQVTGVVLNNGETLEADIVIISAGIRSNLSLIENIEVRTNRGIIVNEFMQTEVDHIYAIGDAAEYDGVNYAIWAEALEQGKVAGAHAVGDSMAYENFVPSTAYNGMGINVFSIGEINPIDTKNVTYIVCDDDSNNIYKKLIFRNNQLVGALTIGDNSKTKLLIDGVNNGKSRQQMLKVMV